MTKSDDIKELATALAKAQGQIGGAATDSNNPFFNSKYADLASVWGAIRKPLSDNGLSVVQTTTKDTVITTLLHSSGQWISGETAIKSKDQISPQAMGSGITYARRYALAAIVGVYQEDDDANKAEGQQEDKAKTKQPTRPTENQPQYKDEFGPVGQSQEAPKSKGPSEPQVKRIYAMAKTLGWSNEDLHTHVMQQTSKDSVKLLTWQEYKKITDNMQTEIDKIKHNFL